MYFTSGAPNKVIFENLKDNVCFYKLWCSGSKIIHKLYDEQFHVTTSFIILFDSLLDSKTKTLITTETALLD